MTKNDAKVATETGDGEEKVDGVRDGAQERSQEATGVEPTVEDTELDHIAPNQVVDTPRDPQSLEYGAKVPTGEKKDGAWKAKRVGMRKKQRGPPES